MPLSKPSGPLVPFALPQLVDLRLYGTTPTIIGFMDLVDVSSPLHDVIIYFEYVYGITVPFLISAMKKILAAYYGCPGMDRPRTVNCLTVSSTLLKDDLTFNAGCSTSDVAHSTSNFKLQFNVLSGVNYSVLVEKTFSLFPLNHIREFTAETLNLGVDDWRRMLRKMECLLCLRLDHLDIGSVLYALDSGDEGVHEEATKTTKITYACTDKSSGPPIPNCNH